MGKDGSRAISSSLSYRIVLEEGQRPDVFACPVLLALTPELDAQKDAFYHRTQLCLQSMIEQR